MVPIELNGKVALVTGCSRRLGKALALELARRGMKLVIHDIYDSPEAAQTAAEANAIGVETLIAPCDLRQPAEITNMFESIRGHFGRLDLLVNSASLFQQDRIPDVSLTDWQQSLDVDLTAPFLCSQHAAHLMRENHSGGSIVNIVDSSAFRPLKDYPQHSVAKAGLAMLTQVLALSLAPDIRVNAVAPGPIMRDDANSPEKWAQLGKDLPIGHTGDPADIAMAIVFLATQPFTTGIILPVNGGDLLR
jgi:pteridine reductase